MADIDSLLNRWQTAGVLDAATAGRIRAYEAGQQRPAGLRWQGLVALILGAILLASGMVLFVSAHWDELGPAARFVLVMAMVAVFHLAGGWVRERYRGLSTALHAVGTVSAGAAIALTGQIFNIQEHWPAAILLWAIAAAAGWLLLADEAQQTLTLLLLPAWIFSEFAFRAEGHIGIDVYMGRLLLVWAVLYLTVFLGSERRIAQGILFGVAAIAALTGIILQLESWQTWSSIETPVPLGVGIFGWAMIGLPLVLALFRRSKSFIPVAVSVAVAIALPWCVKVLIHHDDYGESHTSYSYTEPNLASHILVSALAVFLIWWGVRQASKALVNLGTVAFAISVAWFYFSDIFDKVGRSLGLIGLGILFLAGGWALETMRRKLVKGMAAGISKDAAEEVAP